MKYHELIKKYPKYKEEAERHAAKLEFMAEFTREEAERMAVERIKEEYKIKEQGELFD